jgi:hypothetical protein
VKKYPIGGILDMAKRATKKIPQPVWTKISETSLDSYGYTLFENGDIKIVIESELDYGCCYYEADNPTIETKMVVYKKEYI